MNAATSANSLALTLLLLAPVPGDAQTPPPSLGGTTPQSPAASNVFPSGAEVVRLDIVVRSKDGAPVTDLRPDEIQVSDEGKRCDISSFRLVVAEPAGKPGARPLTAGAAPATTAASTAPSLAPAAGEPLTSVVALVFDQLGAEAAKNARAAALQFAQKPFPKGSVFAVYKVGLSLRILQPFTEDRAALPAAIEKATTGADQARDPSRSPDFDNATEEALSLSIRAAQLGMSKAEGAAMDARFLGLEARMLRQSDLLAREARGMGSLRPLLAIAQALTSVQGRKSLLYFSEGLLVPPNVEDVFQTTVSAANRANVSVYAFDARGLRVRSPLTETKLALELAKLGAMAEQTRSGQPAGGGGSELRLNAQGALQDLAESTGGFLVAETNDLRPGLDRVVSDLRSYYEVGYVPPSTKADGRWHDISVRVSRPGVVVRTRRGYFASPAGSLVIQPYEMPLAEALAAKPLPRELEHRASTLRFASAGETVETLVWVEVPLAGVDFTSADPVYRARVSVLGQVRDEQGELVARLSHDGPIEGPIAGLEAARQGTTVVKKTLRLRPGRYTLETAVQDRGSGRVGARRTAFEIPAPTAGLSLGSVALVRADEVDAGTPAGEDPLRAGALRATPLPGRSIPEGTPVVSLLLTLRAGPGSVAPAVELEFRRDGQVVGKSKPELPNPDASGRITYIGSLPTAQFAAGRYELWVRARLGDSEASEATGFTITPRARDERAVSSTPTAAPGAAEAMAAGALLSAPPRRPVEAAADVLPLLEKAGQYVAEFQQSFRNVVAEETYRQWAGSKARSLRSDLVFVTVPGDLPWATFRDVFEVDGQKVRDRDERLEALFARTSPASIERANAILRDGARFNLGPLYRTVNVPTLALAMLHPGRQWRFRWERKGTRRFFEHDGVELRAIETARPTLVHERDGADLPVEARFWIESGTGRVLRSETLFRRRLNPELSEMLSSIDTQYRPEPRLGLWVPDEMVERYDNVPFPMREDMDHFDGTIQGRARYTNHRRFEVTTDWGVPGQPDSPRR